MAKAAKKDAVSVNMELLAAIGAGKVTHVSQDEAMSAGLTHDPALIQVNTSPDAILDGKAPVRLSDAGAAMVANGAAQPASAPASTGFVIITNAVLPASKRGNRGGGAGAPKKYPFDQLEVGQTFFVAATDSYDPVKKLGSTVSSANMRYAVETGETKQVERTQRGPGNKAVKDAGGNNVRETVTRPVLEQTRKFSLRPVTKGEKYGDWVAPADGALIGRSL